MKTKNLFLLAATLFAISFTSCSNDLIEEATIDTEIQTKSGEEWDYNSNFQFDGIPDYIGGPLVYIDGLDFFRTEIRHKDYETLMEIEPDIYGYYENENENLKEPNDRDIELGITCNLNYVSQSHTGFELRNIPDGGILIIHTVSKHKNGSVYDRYIKVSLENR